MRKTSKDIIKWARSLLDDINGNYEFYERKASFFNLLDKFKEVEETVQKGGLIQDLNGNWCKNGDDIVFPAYSGLTLKIGEADPNQGFFDGRKATGILRRDYQHRRFVFKTDFFTGRDNDYE